MKRIIFMRILYIIALISVCAVGLYFVTGYSETSSDGTVQDPEKATENREGKASESRRRAGPIRATPYQGKRPESAVSGSLPDEERKQGVWVNGEVLRKASSIAGLDPTRISLLVSTEAEAKLFSGVVQPHIARIDACERRLRKAAESKKQQRFASGEFSQTMEAREVPIMHAGDGVIYQLTEHSVKNGFRTTQWMEGQDPDIDSQFQKKQAALGTARAEILAVIRLLDSK